MYTNATFEDGVVIRDNYCAGNGGGIALHKYVFHINNITVTGNDSVKAGSGIHMLNTAKVWIDGDAPVIKNNVGDDMYLGKGTVLQIASTFSAGADINVRPKFGSVFTADYSAHNTADPSQYFHFKWDNSGAEIVNVVLIDGEIACVEPVKYDIDLQVSGEHGTASAPAQAYEGETITISCSADQGYGLSSIAVNGADEIEEGADGTYSFTMPANDVEVYAYFAQQYSIAISDEIAGYVSADRAQACANQRVRLIVDGEMPGILTFTNAIGDAIAITLDEDGYYSFKMPRADTTVSAAYTVSFSQPENGTVTCNTYMSNMTSVSPVTKASGADCTISAVPSSTEYSTVIVIAYTENGEEHVETVTMSSANSYRHTFPMPSANVKVTAIIGEHLASTWGEAQTMIRWGWSVYLTDNISPGIGDSALTVGPNTSITLHLCGFTVDRGLGLVEARNAGSAIINHGRLTVEGPGVITGGNTTGNGGGILSDGSAVEIRGATITGNRANGRCGGVYAAEGEIYMSGPVCVTGNVSTALDQPDNVWLPEGLHINIAGDISGANVGISMELPADFTAGLTGLGDISAFTSDNASYAVTGSGGEAKLSRLYSVTVDDRFITADKAVATEGETVTLNINAPLGFSLLNVTAAPDNMHDAFTVNGNSFTMPAGDVTVTAQWQNPAFGEPDFTLPDGTEEIGNFAFEGAAMTAVWIPDGCTYIGALSFCDCPNLAHVRIPAECEIGTGAFDGCEEVYIFGTAGSPAEAYCQEHANCVFVEETQP